LNLETDTPLNDATIVGLVALGIWGGRLKRNESEMIIVSVSPIRFDSRIVGDGVTLSKRETDMNDWLQYIGENTPHSGLDPFTDKKPKTNGDNNNAKQPSVHTERRRMESIHKGHERGSMRSNDPNRTTNPNRNPVPRIQRTKRRRTTIRKRKQA